MSLLRLVILGMVIGLLVACQSGDESAQQPDGTGGTAENVAATAPPPDKPDNNAIDDEIPDGQLPRDVLPEHYYLTLRIDPATESFSGTVRMDLNFTSAQDHFWLHGNGISVSQASILPTGADVIDLSYQQVHDSGVARLDAEQEIPAGKAVLEMVFSGPFNRSLEGLYRVDAGGDSYAFTQFEASSARLAFPGFDDPWFKTPYDVILEVKQEDTAITNGPELSSSDLPDGWKSVRFATTKPLPTYLVAFAVGPFDVVEWENLPPTEVREYPLPLRGVAVRGKGEQLTFALEGTQAILESLESYFDLPYPYAKLDIIAVPDFSAGAMENAGAITYREQLLLLDENSTAQIKHAYRSVHAHELAHQWFGNLVTPNWWDDIWLNEAFATWMAAVALDRIDSEGGYRRTLLQRSLFAMNVDSLISARQIRQPILSNHDIASAFDGITYSKGGGVLAMFERYLGRDNFRNGIRNYLRQHSWGNANADDFIAAISAQSPEGQADSTADAFLSFLNQPGLPLLQAEFNCSGDAMGKLSQSRYLPLGSDGDAQRQWQIPACVRYGMADGSTGTRCILMGSQETSLSLGTEQCPEWILPNAGGAGYYRFTLGTENWSSLLAASEQLSDTEMLSVSDSYLAAYRAGDLDLTALFDQLPALLNHPNYEVADSVLSDIQEIYEEFADSRAQAEFQKQLIPLYQRRLDQLGLGRLQDRNAETLQANLVEQLGLVLRSPKTRAQLGSMGMAYTGTPTLEPRLSDADINPNLIETAIAIAVREHGKFYFDHVMNLALQSEDATYRQRLLTALGHIEDPALQNQVLELALSDQIRNNEMNMLLFKQATQPATRQFTWEWLKGNLEAVIERVPIWRKGRVSGYTNSFCDEDTRLQVEAFFADKVEDLQGGPRALANTLETIQLCSSRKQHYVPQLKNL